MREDRRLNDIVRHIDIERVAENYIAEKQYLSSDRDPIILRNLENDYWLFDFARICIINELTKHHVK